MAEKKASKERIASELARLKAQGKTKAANRLQSTAAPATVQQGKVQASPGKKAVIQKKPTGVLNILRGSETKLKIQKATDDEMKDGFTKL